MVNLHNKLTGPAFLGQHFSSESDTHQMTEVDSLLFNIVCVVF